MLKVRFTINQAGMAFEYFKDGAWRGALFLNNDLVTENGGPALVKSKVLMGMTDRYDLVPPGEYKDEPGLTVTCV